MLNATDIYFFNCLIEKINKLISISCCSKKKNIILRNLLYDAFAVYKISTDSSESNEELIKKLKKFLIFEYNQSKDNQENILKIINRMKGY